MLFTLTGCDFCPDVFFLVCAPQWFWNCSVIWLFKLFEACCHWGNKLKEHVPRNLSCQLCCLWLVAVFVCDGKIHNKAAYQLLFTFCSFLLHVSWWKLGDILSHTTCWSLVSLAAPSCLLFSCLLFLFLIWDNLKKGQISQQEQTGLEKMSLFFSFKYVSVLTCPLAILEIVSS